MFCCVLNGVSYVVESQSSRPSSECWNRYRLHLMFYDRIY